MTVKLTLEIERENDGRWIVEVVEIPDVLVYGDTRDEAVHEALKVVDDVAASWIAQCRDRQAEGVKIGPRMLARLAKRSGLQPEDLARAVTDGDD